MRSTSYEVIGGNGGNDYLAQHFDDYANHSLNHKTCLEASSTLRNFCTNVLHQYKLCANFFVQNFHSVDDA